MRMQKLLAGIIIALPLWLGLSVLPAVAGPGHGHSHALTPVDQFQAETIASENVARLVDAGKIDVSWKSVKVAEVSQKDYGEGLEWVVVFRNEQVADPKKQTLYVFLNLGGEYQAANYTGD